MTKLTLIPVTPIGAHASPAFVDGHDAQGRRWGELRMVTVNEYPPGRGEEFRRARIARDLSLREAAKALGLSAVDLSSVERGSATLSDDDWQRVFAALASLPAGPERT